MVWEEMLFEEFQDCRHPHLGYRNGTILALLNLCVTAMLPIKFWLNPTNGLGENVVWRISRWPPWRPSWISERNNFSNSESLCHFDASHQVAAQSNLRFGRICRLKKFKIILDIGTEQFKQFWIPMLPQYLPLSFTAIRLTVQEEMSTPRHKLTWSKAPGELTM